MDAKRALDRNGRSAQLLDAALAASRSVLEADLWGVAATVARLAAELVDAQQGSVGLIDAQSGEIYTAASLEVPRSRVRSRFGRGEGVAGWVAATGRAALIPDVRKDPRYLRLRYPAVRSFLSVPLHAGGSLVGVLSCGAWEVYAFGERELQTLTAFGAHAAVALKTVQEMEDLRAQTMRANEALLEGVHDLKAPLSSISGALELLVKQELGTTTPEQREFLGIARQESSRMEGFIAELLETGAPQHLVRLTRRAVPLEQLVDDVVGRLRPAFRTRHVQLAADLERPLPSAEVDPEAIEQVLSNLLANALSVAPAESTVHLEARVHRQEVIFAVSDAGPGIPAEQRERVFERFQQARQAGSASGQIGLGLHIARQIVEQHGGRIWVEPAPAGGASVRFSLPLDS